MTMETTIVSCPNCGSKNRVPAAHDGVPKCGTCGRPLPWIVDATDESFGDVADHATIPVLIDLWAPWCGPCRMVSPALEALARSEAGRFKLVKVDVDRSPALAQRFGVQGIPTLIVLHDGGVVASRTGAAGEATLRAWLDDAINAAV